MGLFVWWWEVEGVMNCCFFIELNFDVLWWCEGVLIVVVGVFVLFWNGLLLLNMFFVFGVCLKKLLCWFGFVLGVLKGVLWVMVWGGLGLVVVLVLENDGGCVLMECDVFFWGLLVWFCVGVIIGRCFGFFDLCLIFVGFFGDFDWCDIEVGGGGRFL